MSSRFVAVNWNRQKRVYDATLVGAILLALVTFAGVTATRFPAATAETIAIRGLGITGLLLLQLIVLIGPLARIDRRFLPLLYNRRHLGVAMALLGLAHAVFAIIQYHALGTINPLVSVLVSNPDLSSVAQFPFELLGLVGLAILVLMAATSHDFWLSVLTPRAWKALHMVVYVAYAALLGHVALGLMQSEPSPLYPLSFGAFGLGTVLLHLIAARREAANDRIEPADQWVDAGLAGTIPEGRARVRLVGGERVAIFRHEGKLSALSNVCRHQNGPLGEGRIVDGCVTCPWHGYQYRPDTGTSPPPFNDQVETFQLRISGGRVLVRTRANPPGTRVEPIEVEPAITSDSSEFYVGYLPRAPIGTARFVRATIGLAIGLAVAVEAAFAWAQRGYDDSRFEYGSPTSLVATVRERPYPMIEVDRPGQGGDRVSRYLLAAGGKHGAQAAVASLDGRRVAIRGTLAYRGNVTLLELIAAEPVAGPAPAAPPPTIDRGKFELEGEIVDSKCYAGVMNPGRGKTHRGCAARCLAGGITPLFVVKDTAGQPLELVLLTERGEPFPEAERLAGKPVAVTGRVRTLGDLWLIEAATVRSRP